MEGPELLITWFAMLAAFAAAVSNLWEVIRSPVRRLFHAFVLCVALIYLAVFAAAIIGVRDVVFFGPLVLRPLTGIVMILLALEHHVYPDRNES